MDFSEVQLSILNPNALTSENYSDFEQLYHFWRPIWLDNHKGWGMPGNFSSDSLTRQTEVLCLWYKSNIIASISHRYADLSLKSTMEDSFFSVWKDSSKQKLKKIGKKAVIGSQITVDPAFRKSHSGLFTKLFITFLSFHHLNLQNLDVIAGMVRSDKGIRNLFTDCGANTFEAHLNYFSVPIDIVVFQPQVKPISIPQNYANEIKSIYNSRKGDKNERKTTTAYQQAG